MALFKILKGSGNLPTAKTEGWAYVKKINNEAAEFYVDYDANTRLQVGKQYNVVSATEDGIVPKFDAADGRIDSNSSDWVLTNNNGSLGWYRLPTNAFKNDNTNTTYTLSGAASGNTWVTTLTGSDSATTTSTVPAASTTAAGLMTPAMVEKLNGIAAGATANTGDITQVTAGNGLTGGATSGNATLSASLGTGLVFDANKRIAVNTTYASAGKSYAVKTDSSGALYVNVPWSDTDTHHVTRIYTGASGATANATSPVSNPYITVTDNNVYRTQVQLKGGGATSISADDGVITISSTNTTYSAFKGASASANGGAGLVPAPAKGQEGYYLRGDGVWFNLTGMDESVQNTFGALQKAWKEADSSLKSTLTTLINSKAQTNHASNTSNYGLSTASLYGHAKASSTTPKASAATAVVGSEAASFARGDHVHPLTVSNSWTAGSAAGPSISTTVNNVTGAAISIPAATASASGAVIVGDQTFGGIKRFSATDVSYTHELGAYYSYSNGYLIELGTAATQTMIAIHISGNSYTSSDLPIDSWFQFYDYNTSEGILQPSGINNGYPLGAMTVYRYNNKLYAWIAQGRSYQTLAFTVYTNVKHLTPVVTNAAKHTTNTSFVTTITPYLSLNTLNYNSYVPKLDGTGATGTWNINILGSAAKLTTPRAINGTNFDGSAAITTAKWGTARTLTVGNKGQSVDGSGNVSWGLHDILYSGAISSTSSWDITNPGVYYVAPASNSTAYSGTGNPETNTLNNGTLYRWGQLIVSRANNGGLAQFYIAHQDSTEHNCYGIHFRTGWNNSYLGTWRVLLDSVNYTNWCDGRYVNISGDTLTGALNFKNGTWNNVGDDAAMGDCNQAGMFGIKGLNGATGIYFTPYSGSTAQKISIDGSGTMTITGTVASTFSGNLTGNATTATTASKLGSATIGNTLTPIYLNGGTATACETFNNRLYDYNKARVYHYSFGGAQDLNWKKVFAASHTTTAPSSATYVGATIKGTIYHHKGNYNQEEVDEYPFQMNMVFLSGTSVSDKCTLKVAAGCPDTIIRAVRVSANSFELQVRQPNDWQTITIQFSYSGGASTMQAFTPVNSSNASVIAFTTLSNSRTNIANQAITLARGGDTNYPMQFNWSGQSGQPSWLWGGDDGTNMYVYNPSNFNVNYANSAGSASTAANADKLDGYHASSFGINYNVGNVNLNTQTNSGFYRLGQTITNGFTNAAYGQMLVVHGGGDTIGQIGIPYNESGLYVRQGNPSDVGGAGSWKPWVRILDSNNYTSYTDSRYVNVSGDTMTGTLILSKTTDASGTANNKPALIVGGTDTQAHIEIDANEIMAKASGTTVAELHLNADGGKVNIGNGGLFVGTSGISTTGDIHATNTATTDRSIRATNANGSVSLHTSTNRGLYDHTRGAWIIYSRASDNTTRIPQHLYTDNGYITASTTMYLSSASGTSLIFRKGTTAHARFDTSGHFIPETTATYNLGGTEKLWNTIHGHHLQLLGTTDATMTAASTNPRITFAEGTGSQPVHLIYTDYDNYRGPAGLKVIGGTSATPAWFEVEGTLHAARGAIGGYDNTTYALSTASFICNSWVRTNGSTGWYNETHGGGWYMSDGTFVRSYSSKAVLVGNNIYIGTTAGNGTGLALYSTSAPTVYGIHMSTTANYGKFGDVQSDWATYFNMNAVGQRGWIYRAGSTNVASISANGIGAFKGITTSNRGNSEGTYYSTGLEIREYNYSGAGADSWGQAPRLSFHWSGRVAAQIGLASNGYLYTAPSTGTTFYKLVYESGTWGISITGNAATATLLSIHNTVTSTTTRSTHASSWNGGISGVKYMWGQAFKDTSIGSDTGDIVFAVRPGVYTSGGTELCVCIDGDYYSMGNKVLHAGNYTDYTVTKTGSGASGTWGINITGSAGSVAWANVTGKPSTFTPSSHTHSYAGSSSAGGAANSANVLNINATANLSNCLQYIQQSSQTSGNDLPSAAWWHVLKMNHGTGDTYFKRLLAFDFFSNKIKTANAQSNGTVSAWKTVWVEGDSVTGAVWNDYAEYRESDCQEFGRVLSEKGDDTLTMTAERLQPFAGISSDTWGFCQGETEKAKTPIAVAGRVLAYTYKDRNEYKPGDCVCAAPNGTVDIMTREEIIQYPDRIVGTVSCVPDYETWGSGDRDPVQVNGRIWIKVK